MASTRDTICSMVVKMKELVDPQTEIVAGQAFKKRQVDLIRRGYSIPCAAQECGVESQLEVSGTWHKQPPNYQQPHNYKQTRNHQQPPPQQQ